MMVLCSIPPSGWWCSREAGHEGPCAARSCRYPLVQNERGGITYGPWSIRYERKPIPTSACDWSFEHENYDASYEGPEDGWVGNGLCGTAGSLADVIAECDAIDGEGDESCHPASVDERLQGHDPEGHGAKPASAVPKGDAQPQSSEGHSS